MLWWCTAGKRQVADSAYLPLTEDDGQILCAEREEVVSQSEMGVAYEELCR